MVGHEQHALVAERGADALALVHLQRQAAVIVVVGDVVVKARAVLMDRLDAHALERRQRRGVGHVGVQHAAGVRELGVNGAVDAGGGFVYLALPFHEIARGIHHQQIAGADFAEVQPERIEQKAPAVIADGNAEMIGDGLVPAEACCQSESRRKIDS